VLVDTSVIPLVVYTVCMSVLGALAQVILWAKKPSDITTWEAVQSLIIGVIAGFLYATLRVEHGLPDGAMSFVVGYTAKDFIEAVAEKLKPDLTRAQS